MFWNKWFEPRAFNSGYLPEVDGHRVFFQEFGNPEGRPVLVFHGGPGGSFKARHAQDFDLKNTELSVLTSAAAESLCRAGSGTRTLRQTSSKIRNVC